MNNNDVYILNPQYYLRNDVRRILLYSKSRTDIRSCSNWYAFIHPLQAVMLSFFTHKRSLKKNIFLLSKYFHCELSEMEHYVAPFIDNSHTLCAHWHGREIAFPKNMIVPAEKDDIFKELSPQEFVCQSLDLDSHRLYCAPLSITIMLTNKCVTTCCYCYADTRTPIVERLRTSRICELIEEAGKLHMKHVNLIGGEVFLHPDWHIILKKAVDCNVEPEYISTKVPLTQEIVNRLLLTGYKGIIQLSLDTINNDILKKSLNVSDNYLELVKKGFMLLDDSGLKYQVSTVLTTYNSDFDLLKELYDFLSHLKNITTWNIVPVHNSLNPRVEDFRLLKPSYKQLNELFKQIEEYAIKNSKLNIAIDKDILTQKYYSDDGGSNFFNGSRCSALSTHFFILPDGKVSICEQIYWHPYFIIGDVNKGSLSEVWNSERAKYLYDKSWKDISPSSNCFGCVLNQECFKSNNRCWVDIMKAYGKNNYDYPDPRCKMADKMKNYIGY